jgi:hypothetical protein
MNNREAKFILSAYRPNGVDANDEVFAEALRQAQRDPALSAWLASEQALDEAIIRKFKEIAPPAGLREAILTGGRVSGSRRRFLNQSTWIGLGAAAAILIVASLAVWPNRASADTRALAEFALRDNTAGDRHRGHGTQVEALQRMLGNPDVPMTKSLAIDFDVLRRDGCRTLGFDGHEVLEICFNRDGTWFHLYAMRGSPDAGERAKAPVTIAGQQTLACTTWTDRSTGVLFALVSNSGLESLKNVL